MEGAMTNDIVSMIERIAIAIGLIVMAIERLIKSLKQNTQENEQNKGERKWQE
jgi:hypothetical protein